MCRGQDSYYYVAFDTLSALAFVEHRIDNIMPDSVAGVPLCPDINLFRSAPSDQNE